MSKKLIAIILAVFMVSTAFPFAGYAEDTIAGAETGVSVPENIIRLLEFLGLVDTTTLTGDNPVSYEVFCTAYQKISGIPAVEVENKSSVTYAYVLRNLVSALGYDAYAAVKGGYPYGYIAVANELELLSGVTVMNYEQDFVSNDSFCMILYNALMADMYMIDGITTNGSDVADYSYFAGNTALEEIFDIAYSEGVLVGTEKSDIYGENLSEDAIKIDGVKMPYSGESVHHLLGHRVEYFYDIKSSEKKVLFVNEHEEQNITTVYSDEIVGMSGGYFTYEPYGASSDKKIQVPSGTVVLKNGVFEGYTGTIDISAVLNVERGRINFIDNDNSKGIDCISMTEYDVRVVDSVNTSLEILHFKNGFGMIALGEEYTPDGKEVEYSIRHNGSVFELDRVLPWDAALIAHAENKNGKLYYDIEIIRRTVSGTLTGAGDDVIYIDDERYTIAPSFDKTKIKLGLYGEFVIAGNDDVADVKMLRSYMYGYLMDSGSEKGLSAESRVKIMAENGKTEILSLCDKIKFNGSVVSAEAGLNLLKDKYMLLAYRTNPDGKITAIYTDRGMGRIENEFSMDADHTSNDGTETGNARFGVYREDVFVYSEPFFNGLYQPSSECVIFYVHPDVIDKGTAPDDNQILVGGSTSIKSTIDVTTDAENYFVRAQMFDTDEFYRADAIVIYRDDVAGGSVSSGYSSVMVIDSVTTALVNGEELYKIRYYKDKSVGIETAYADPSDIKKIAAFSYYPFKHHDKITSFADLKCGDVIQASVGKDGEITAWRPLFLMNQQYNDGDYWGSGVYYFSNSFEMIYSTIKQVDGINFIASSIDMSGKTHDRFFRITAGDDAECFVYDSSTKRLTRYPDMSIADELVPGARFVALQTGKRIMMQIVIK